MHLPFLMLIERSEIPILLGGCLDPKISPRTSQTPKDFDYPKVVADALGCAGAFLVGSILVANRKEDQSSVG